MEKLVIGANVLKVGKEAFRNCRNLASAEIGKNVASIGSGAFKGCLALKSVKLRSGKLDKASFKGILNGSRVKTVKLAGMTKSQRKAAIAKYAKWLPAGVRLK